VDIRELTFSLSGREAMRCDAHEEEEEEEEEEEKRKVTTFLLLSVSLKRSQ
jgi:hypothetical protein